MKTNNQNQINTHFLFEKVNYKFLLIGLGVIALGFILMAGGGSDDPNVFNPEIFNFRRIRLAPTVVLTGFGIVIYSIIKSPYKVTTEIPVPPAEPETDTPQPNKKK